MLPDLSTPWARHLQIFLTVAFDFWCTVFARLDFVAQLLEPIAELGLVNSCGVLLSFVQLLRLNGMVFPVVGFGEVEKHDMSVKLRRRSYTLMSCFSTS